MSKPKKVKSKKIRKPAAKKTTKKRAVKKKVLVKKSAAAKKSIGKKAAKKKTAKKKTAIKKKTAPKQEITSKTPLVKPRPRPTGMPPVEEPAANEEALGTITHYYSHLNVAVVQLNKGTLKAGDTIHVKGHTTDFTQKVESMEFEHQHIDQTSAGQSFGLKVKDPAREHDIVYLVK